ncbi:hypothetical protein [Candidatus Midichloria mitochondrii]|nr:hypothetical protein [Candidatus Midichloria mitochondrii]
MAYVFKPNISHGKIGSRAYSLRQTEVILIFKTGSKLAEAFSA